MKEFSVMCAMLASPHGNKYCPLAPLWPMVACGVEKFCMTMDTGSFYTVGSQLMRLVSLVVPASPHLPLFSSLKHMADVSW